MLYDKSIFNKLIYGIFTWIIDGVSPLLTRNLGFEFTACFTFSNSPPSMKRRNATKSSDFKDLKLKLLDDILENDVFFSTCFTGDFCPKTLKRSASTTDLKSLNLAALLDLIAESVSRNWVNTFGVPIVYNLSKIINRKQWKYDN